MNRLQLILLLAVCAGCSKATPEFVQGNMRIALPVSVESRGGIHDGGSVVAFIRDAKRRQFIVFYDHAMFSPTPGAIYLGDNPDAPGVVAPRRVRVLDVADFKTRVGDFDGRP